MSLVLMLKKKLIWNKLSINPKKYSGKWYLETGLGMGSSINVAIGKGNYIFADRGTWLNFKTNVILKFCLYEKNFVERIWHSIIE